MTATSFPGFSSLLSDVRESQRERARRETGKKVAIDSMLMFLALQYTVQDEL